MNDKCQVMEQNQFNTVKFMLGKLHVFGSLPHSGWTLMALSSEQGQSFPSQNDGNIGFHKRKLLFMPKLISYDVTGAPSTFPLT